MTKNRGIARACAGGADVVVVLDDDCYPVESGMSLAVFAQKHLEALNSVLVPLFTAVTEPPSRGTPYGEMSIRLPVAASMGFWEEIGDYCAVRQLAHQAGPMRFRPQAIYGRWFPLSGMNVAFRPRDWWPWCRFIDVPRFDDIWMGWLWQREAYRRGYCFNLAGPTVRHVRQSNVWRNLAQEAKYLEYSETLWQDIFRASTGYYDDLRALLPIPDARERASWNNRGGRGAFINAFSATDW